jgi:hypothetical protein
MMRQPSANLSSLLGVTPPFEGTFFPLLRDLGILHTYRPPDEALVVL